MKVEKKPCWFVEDIETKDISKLKQQLKRYRIWPCKVDLIIINYLLESEKLYVDEGKKM